ncbi:MAG: Aspartyl/glutamyl-tRNA(Asn/Gln) amidotransferase subunit C [Candidatus Moranbacteria bacterium GW2011_GWE2_35_2-]|nr:MAG: Aspartyl/glutamyl-tRNA(Asn/Gln) amidotransferase subunit C [Candidatus Moranbacteria bacterium GW2011_GWE2_35_2-]KKQ22521.1 MAG: Aspartyl/glutamyl-tRNA(Asn/Gln) amidotransferase subunit C [Candidatus Moranbacteria bacterium GW2011_GWF2_37_11]KKQ29590.1 MAG: Aspartyl/glutamyl-tRNA(Asn/Gln) amidotransferase subunit C [Candidatus Moranbacteria bacterium GW2011_GWD1_37_17]KKQ30539.1 MAG: Aspartyl/glutamyl-tRNA(Asn/Gln) amidotransferase subunit C [Candidatus Moranbacteria bacterium GW2011_GWE
MLTKQEIKNVAALARLGLQEENIERYQKDLSGILDYFKQMEELDTENIQPIGHIAGTSNVFREDQKKELDEKERNAILKNAPEIKNDLIKVRSVL